MEETTQPASQLLTVPDVGAVLNVSLQYVQHLIRTGQLPVVELGHKTKRIRAADVNALIQSKMLQAPPAKRVYPKANLEKAHEVLRSRKPAKNGVDVQDSIEKAERALMGMPSGDELEL